jgi:hypothetical protein
MGGFLMRSVLPYDTVYHVIEGGHLHAFLEQIEIIIAVAKPIPATLRIDLKKICLPIDRKELAREIKTAG